MNEHNMRDFCRSAYDSYSERTLLLSAFPTGTSGAQIKARADLKNAYLASRTLIRKTGRRGVKGLST
jgi:hypothetical protein